MTSNAWEALKPPPATTRSGISHSGGVRDYFHRAESVLEVLLMPNTDSIPLRPMHQCRSTEYVHQPSPSDELVHEVYWYVLVTPRTSSYHHDLS